MFDWYEDSEKYLLDVLDEVLVNSTTYDHDMSSFIGIREYDNPNVARLIGIKHSRHFNPPKRRDPWSLRRYQVTLCPDAGKATVMYTSQWLKDPSEKSQFDVAPGDDLGRGASLSNRGYHARSKVINLAGAYRLGTFVTLTYSSSVSPKESYDNFSNYIRRVFRAEGGGRWVEVSEYGKRGGRLHHHVLFESDVDVKDLRRLWHGSRIDVRHANTIEAIRSSASYICKGFLTSAEQRPHQNRYRKSRSMPHPKTITLRLTDAELNRTLREMGVTNVRWYYPTNPESYVAKIASWDPRDTAHVGFNAA